MSVDRNTLDLAIKINKISIQHMYIEQFKFKISTLKFNIRP